jgi:hypothetical protein
VAAHEWGEPDDVLIEDRVAVCAELIERGVHVESGQWRRIRSRSILPRAAMFSGP